LYISIKDVAVGYFITYATYKDCLVVLINKMYNDG